MQFKIEVPMPNKRMLPKEEAAEYIGISKPKDKKARLRTFDAVCPIAPVDMPIGARWDVRDLDKWLDDMKENKSALTVEDIVSKLG